MSIAAKTTIIRSERSPGERVKLLRYCLARLRAWEMEYRLYSSRSTNIDPPKRTVEHLDSPVETEGLVQPTEQEPIMVRNVPQPSTHYETPTISWESIVGAIDTHSISTTEMPYPVETPRATPPTVRHDEYALSHDAPRGFSEQSARQKYRDGRAGEGTASRQSGPNVPTSSTINGKCSDCFGKADG